MAGPLAGSVPVPFSNVLLLFVFFSFYFGFFFFGSFIHLNLNFVCVVSVKILNYFYWKLANGIFQSCRKIFFYFLLLFGKAFDLSSNVLLGAFAVDARSDLNITAKTKQTAASS